MRHTLLTMLVCAALPGAIACGHGHPIIVSTENNRLTVGGGVAGADDGYVDQIYVETDSSGDPEDFADFVNFGPGIYWTVPGFEISGLAENSGLYLQTLARPVWNANPNERRTLWYWDSNSSLPDKVENAPSASRLQIRQTSTVNALLTPTTTVAPSAIKLAAPIAADMGFHNHDLVRYVLPAPLPDDGAYAFFARLMSDLYAPSDPFLVMINNNVLDGNDMLTAAADINRAAFLPGDFNHDDRVDAADYVIWRNNAGTTQDYQLWRGGFGATFSGPGSAVGTTSVPEPVSLLIVGTIVGPLTFTLRRRR